VKKQLQKATRKINHELIAIKNGYPDTISFWIEAYFRYEVTTSVSSQKVQKRDLTLFRDFFGECMRERGAALLDATAVQGLQRLVEKD
jgi:hypothetical protein